MTSLSGQNSLLRDLESAIQSRDAKQRAVMLERITALFLSATHNQDQVELFDNVFLELVRHVETTARAKLSECLAREEAAPFSVIQSLARDHEIDVARPVLAHSNRVSEDTLVEVARTRDDAHLLSIAGRSQIAEAISDVLVERGSNEVVRRLSGNAAARFSENGLTLMATRAASDEGIAINIANRSDVPPRIFRQLLNQATIAVRNSLLSGASSEQHHIISRAMEEASREISRASSLDITAEVRRIVYEAFEKRQLKEATVLEFARAKMAAEVAVSLAVMTSTPIEIVEQQILSGRMSGILLLCKSQDFNWPTAKTIISMMRDRSDSELEQAREEYYTLSVQSAMRAMRFVGARQTLLKKAAESSFTSPLVKPAMRTLLN